MLLSEDLNSWAQQALESRGALVEASDDGSLRAMLPETLAEALHSSEWLQLRFGAGAGADDPVEWLDRLAVLLPAGPRLITARPRYFSPAGRIDAQAMLAKELVLQNGVCRWIEDYADTGLYYFFSFAYEVESNERMQGLITVALNGSSQSMVTRPERMLAEPRDAWVDDEESSAEGMLATVLPVALRRAEAEARQCARPMWDNASRRLGRDVERVTRYYAGLLEQIEKRRRKASSEEKEARERERAAATEADRTAKLEDLRRKHSVKLRVRLADVLAARLPVRAISVRLIRKKEERRRILHWNPVLRELDAPWCESCGGPAHPLFLCDDRVHCLCRQCLGPCAGCARVFCRACQKRCKCGAVETSD